MPKRVFKIAIFVLASLLLAGALAFVGFASEGAAGFDPAPLLGFLKEEQGEQTPEQQLGAESAPPPANSAPPAETAQPSTLPENSPTPESTAVPESTATPEPSATPQSTLAPHSTQAPELTPSPTPVQKPVAVALQEAQAVPQAEPAVRVNEDGSVTPGEGDYEFASGKITKLKQAFINSLDETQKNNIRLVIPGTINGVAVTAIGDNAFKAANYSGCTFISLELSQATGLKSIGAWAFYGASKITGPLVLPDGITTIDTHAFDGASGLSGDLVIPSSVTTIGTYAFSNCSGMKGTLRIDAPLTTISNYAFAYTGFTGTLTLPATLTTIGESAFRQSNPYQGFSSVVIPEGVKEIQKVAFSYQKALAAVTLPQTLTTIGDSAFRYAGLSGVLKIPASVKTMGTNAFAETNITTVYIPDTAAAAAAGYLQSSTFTSSAKLTAIVCAKGSYTALYNSLNSTDKAKLGYPVTVTFSDGGQPVFDGIERVYNRPLNLVKQADESWAVDASYRLPTGTNSQGNPFKWAFSAASLASVSESALVTNTTLHAINPPAAPTITFGPSIDGAYKTEGYPLTVTAGHPLAKPIGQAKSGDVVFYYTWRWATIGTSPSVLEGFDKNQYNVMDVREPNYTIVCTVTVQTCLVNDENKAVVFNTQTHDFGVHLTQAEPVVNPVCAREGLKPGESLPAISLSPGDTPGALEWEEGQLLQEGSHNYNWVFTPTPNAVGNCNYTGKTGTITLSVSLQNEIVSDMIEQLPALSPDETPTPEQVSGILNAKVAYDDLNDAQQGAISEAEQQKLCEALAKLPQITVEASAGIALPSAALLLENMTGEDAKALSSDPTATLSIAIEQANTAPSEQQAALLAQTLNGAVLSKCYEVQVVKTLEVPGQAEQITTINKLRRPLRLVFAIPPETAQAASGTRRDFAMLRLHQEQGVWQTELLQDEDDDPNTITIHSDRFSLYALAYNTVSIGGSQPPRPSVRVVYTTYSAGGAVYPSGPVEVEQGKNQSFAFAPQPGYQIDRVVLDGAELGALNEYTLQDIKADHTLLVTFKMVPTASGPAASASTGASAAPSSAPEDTPKPAEATIPPVQTPEPVPQITTEPLPAQAQQGRVQPWLLWGGGALALALICVAVLVWLRKRKR